jgi:N6-adenosine-specific RNA methylase IME4
MGRPPIKKRAMTDPERQRKRRKKVAEQKKRAPLLAKQELRPSREREIGEKIKALPTKQYCVLLADPNWRFKVYSRLTGLDRSADNHYPTSELEKIKALDIPSIVAPDYVLYLWATVPMLPQALEVMAAWGFKYVSSHVWVKTHADSEGLERVETPRAGTGYWIRHELLLVGKRGKIPAPAMGTQIGSVIIAPVGRHSTKPEIVAQTIERHFPTPPRIELFARGKAGQGWDVWGPEAED